MNDDEWREALRRFGWLRPDADGIERMHDHRPPKAPEPKPQRKETPVSLPEEFFEPGSLVRLAVGVVCDTAEGRLGRPIRYEADDEAPDGRRAVEIEGGHMDPARVVRVTGGGRERKLVVQWGGDSGPWAVLSPEELEGVARAIPPEPTREEHDKRASFETETRFLAESLADEVATLRQRIVDLERKSDIAEERADLGRRRADGPEGFVTRREMADAIAAVVASMNG
jgi:hypothetical protein